jgi:hypothetical protein
MQKNHATTITVQYTQCLVQGVYCRLYKLAGRGTTVHCTSNFHTCYAYYVRRRGSTQAGCGLGGGGRGDLGSRVHVVPKGTGLCVQAVRRGLPPPLIPTSPGFHFVLKTRASTV